MFNGKENSGYAGKGNRYKVIHTKSNSRLLLDDETGDVTLESAKGQTIAIFYGDGNIEIKAPENINISAGKSINITAGENINMSAGMNISESAGATHSTIAGGMMSQMAGLDYTLMAANIMEVAQGERKSKAKEVTDQSGKKEVLSEDSNSIHSQGKLNNNSGDHSNFQ